MNHRYSQKLLKRCLLASLLYLPTSLLALFLVALLAYNGASVFSVHVPFSPVGGAGFSPEKSPGDAARRLVSSTSSAVMLAVKKEEHPTGETGLRQGNSDGDASGNAARRRVSSTSSDVTLAVKKEENPTVNLNAPVTATLLRKPHFLAIRRRPKKYKNVLKILRAAASSSSRRFPVRVKRFFKGSPSKSSCEVRFFMTWISSLRSFGKRELLAIESLFKSHLNACLVIVSNSMDSVEGTQLLRPFVESGFRVAAVSPDFDFIFNNTKGEIWFNRLKKGRVKPGGVSLGQNLSNLLRLALLYKYGGIYIDTDVIVLKSLSGLRNTIGAQAVDPRSGNWSRLNNAVMIFDKEHPILSKFIEEFALTFDGSKWGHNGPYLVSRVVSRLMGRPGFDITVLPPEAFYPVSWNGVHMLFRGPENSNHSGWSAMKLEDIRQHSFAVHLWNRESRTLKVEEGSVMGSVMRECCLFCNSSMQTLHESE